MHKTVANPARSGMPPTGMTNPASARRTISTRRSPGQWHRAIPWLVQKKGVFINNEHDKIPDTEPTMDNDQVRWAPYTRAITRWLPGARVAPAATAGRQWDAVVKVGQGRRARTWAAEVRQHLAHQDAAILAVRLRALAAARHARPLLLAPYVRVEQAQIFQDAGVDYVDLAGNVHIEAPERFVHVEGKRPVHAARPAGRPTKGWVKTVMAILIQPALLDQPYRAMALAGDVATGTVTACLKHFGANRFLAVQGANRKLRAVPDLIALWVGAYVDVLRPRLAERRFQLRAVNKPDIWELLRGKLGRRDIHWALTGADAAQITVGHFHAENTEVYAPVLPFEDRDLLVDLRAQPAARGNLLVIDPPGPLALMTEGTAIPTAPSLLQYAELRYRGTEQAREAADLLLPKLLEHAEP
jgi:hypothetical protein